MLLGSTSLYAAAPVNVPAGNPRTTEDLRAIEARVKDVIKKSLPATVGIAVDNGQGSGVIVGTDGYVLTAGHVCVQANKPCTLILADGRRVRGKTLGINSAIDSGMIKILDKAPPDGWPHVSLPKHVELKAGEWTVALGHPLGYRKDRPPVARLGRVILSSSKALWTDNPLINGDSGGPLFDLSGNLIGIHSRIGASTVSNIHVPIDTYVQTWERLAAAETWGGNLLGFEARGKAVLGITALEDDKGIKVSKVIPQSPAARAGVKVGDFILKFNNTTVSTPEELVSLMGKRKPGDAVNLEVRRDEKTLTLTAKLMARMY